MDINFKYRLSHPFFDYILTEGASNLIDSRIFGEGCASASICSFLASLSPVLASCNYSWDGVILAETSSENLSQLLEFCYSGRCYVSGLEEKIKLSGLLTSLGMSFSTLTTLGSSQAETVLTPPGVPSVSLSSSPVSLSTSEPLPKTSSTSTPRLPDVKRKVRKIDNVKCEMCDVTYKVLL